MALSDVEIERYARQLLVPGMGEAGQERLASARVRVVGAGPVAGPAMTYLAEAGIGHLLVDLWGLVEPAESAAWIYGPGDAGRPRAEAAVDALRRVSRLVKVDRYQPSHQPTAVLVCAQSPGERIASAEEARQAGLPCLVAEASGDGGRVVVVPVGEPCYRCAGEPAAAGPPTPGAVAAMGALSALELVLLIAGAGQEPGARRIELARGVPSAAANVRKPGCACARAT